MASSEIRIIVDFSPESMRQPEQIRDQLSRLHGSNERGQNPAQ
jgi:hypothetical protein